MASASEIDPQPIGTFWVLNLEEPLPDGVTPRLAARFARVDAEAALVLARAMGLDDPASVLKRFARQCRCYGAWVDETLAAYGWVTFDEERIGELGVRFRLLPGEAYIWDCATLPAYRGQRLYPALLGYIVKELQAEGFRLVWIGADSDNLASQKGFRLAGFQPVADVISAQQKGPVGILHLRGRLDGPGELDRHIMVGRFRPDVDWLPKE
jgi:ribosomal protein S18 acetylase RimI-like enzyme